jgi:transcriptional regulator with XRE-family HTH domain
MGFRENLKQELILSGMVKKELAAASGVHQRAIDTYLRANASMPPADTAVNLARALGVTVEYLVTGEISSVPKDIHLISRNLLKLSEKDRKVVLALVKAMIERKEDS